MNELDGLTIGTREAKYKARAWRTDVLRREAADEVTKLLQAFVPTHFEVGIRECDEEVPGFPHAPRYKFAGKVADASPDGSDAHFIAFGYTRDGVVARLLAHILDGGGFYPLT